MTDGVPVPDAVHPHRRGDSGHPGNQCALTSRFTPTGVGTANCDSLSRGSPRGSPPQAWGQRVHPPPPERQRPVHPHRRGDSGQTNWTADSRAGSLPQAWGQRMCNTLAIAHHGSPPQAWGQQRAALAVGDTGRFNPTGVGTAPLADLSFSPAPVHPHRRGDSEPMSFSAPAECGSPPQAWGQRDRADLHRRMSRFTPTGVGTAIPSRSDEEAKGGSPPQAWGQHTSGTGNHCRPRFTPTGVGTA